MDTYQEIEHIAKRIELNDKIRNNEGNTEKLEGYWEIGKLIVEAQGGEAHAKYGNGLIKAWSEKLTRLYGKNYSERNLRKMRQYYLVFSKWPTVWATSWSHIREVLSIKDENKRNYYINMCITRNLSVRELANEIKNKSYERLVNKPQKIEIIPNVKKYTFLDDVKDPIIIKINNEQTIKTEKDLEDHILANFASFLTQLGEGFSLVNSEYKIVYENKNYYIDLLLFNYKMNAFVVVELKMRELKKEDKGQVEFYMNLVDEKVKEAFHNKTIGIILSKKQDKFIASFVGKSNIIPLTYKLNYIEKQ